jgi:hypothetical protein
VDAPDLESEALAPASGPSLAAAAELQFDGAARPPGGSAPAGPRPPGPAPGSGIGGAFMRTVIAHEPCCGAATGAGCTGAAGAALAWDGSGAANAATDADGGRGAAAAGPAAG